MRKVDEVSNEHSCFNKAGPLEQLFVLLGRDAAAPYAIREWCKQRILLGKNSPGDMQIEEALHCASEMEKDFHR